MPFRRRRYLSLLGTTVIVGSAGCSELSLPWDQRPDFPRDPTQQAKLVANNRDSTDSFGWAAALSSDGTTAIVGDRRADSAVAESSGAAYVFVRSDGGWTQQTKLTTEWGSSTDLFGSAVALSGDGTTALVGAIDTDSVYIFERSDGSWAEQGSLSPDDGYGSALFGGAVALSRDGTTACVGADDAGGNGFSAGAVYLFDIGGDEYTKQAKLTAPQGVWVNSLGSSVALSSDGTTALAGELGAVNQSGPPGSAYVFDGSDGAWTQQARLTADDGDQGDVFGCAVDLSEHGTTALVGAREDNASGPNSGSAYVFERSNGSWTQETKLTPYSGDRNDNFGKSVALSSDGTIACIAAIKDENPDGSAAGSVHVFERSDSEWTQTGEFSTQDRDSDDIFGWAMDLSSDGTTSLVSAFEDGTLSGNGGSAFVFTL